MKKSIELVIRDAANNKDLPRYEIDEEAGKLFVYDQSKV